MEFNDKDKAFQHLLDTIHSYQPEETCEDVKKAYALAEEAHKDQRRVSGEPYILHPLAVAQILAEMQIDTKTITASLLHDVVEDQIQISKDILLLEGNWLLLQEEGWKELKQFCDYSIFIQAEEDMLKQRLIERKIQGGLSRSEAIAFYERSDGRNVSRVLQHSMQADLTLRLSQDMRFCKEEIK